MSVRFLFGSKTDDVTLSATSGTASNMQTGGPARTWESDSLSEQNITADMGQSEDWNVIHLENINFDEAVVVQFSDDNFDTIKHAEQFSKWAKDLTYAAATHWITGQQGGDKILDVNGDGILDANGDAILDNSYNAALPISAQYIRPVVADSDNPDGYVAIGRLMAGEYYEVSESPDVSINKSFDYRERGPQIETRGGAWRQMERDPQRRISIEYAALHEDDATDIEDTSLSEYLRTVGPRGDILVSVYPQDTALSDRERLHTIMGRITQRSAMDGRFLASDDGTMKLYSRLTFQITESL